MNHAGTPPVEVTRHVATHPLSGRRWIALDLLAGVACLIAFSISFKEALSTLWFQWNDSPTHSYGMLIGPIALYLVWTTRDRWQHLSPRPALVLGWTGVVVGVITYRVGILTGIASVQQLAMFTAFVGLLLLLFGKQIVRRWALPLVYCTLMFPIWDIFIARFHWPLQLTSADLATRVLRAADIPAFRESIWISLPNIVLAVQEVCSGVGYLIAVVALGIPAAFLFLTGVTRRVILIAFSVAVAALSNSVRIALVGYLAYHGYDGPLHGPGHILTGMFVSGAGYLAIAVAVVALRWRQPDRGQPAGGDHGHNESQQPDAPVPSSPDRGLRPVFRFQPASVRALVAATLLLLIAAFTTPSRLVASTPSTGLPDRIGAFSLIGTPPAVDAEWTREGTYRNIAGDRVKIVVSPIVSSAETYMKTPAVRELAIHGVGTVPLRSGTTTLQNGSIERHASWSIVNGREFTSTLSARMYQAWQAGLGRPVAAGMVLTTTDAAPAVLDEFLASGVPVTRGMFSVNAPGVRPPD